MTDLYDLVIVGAGASGVFTAINFKQKCPNAKVVIIEKSNKSLSKVKISGGGRCNVTHNCFSTSDLIKNYPRGGKKLKNIFSQFGVKDTFNFFETRNVPLKIETDGRVFPQSNSSQSIIDCFTNELEKLNIAIKFQHDFIDFEKKGDVFDIKIKDKPSIKSHFLQIAIGGMNKLQNFDFLADKYFKIAAPIPSLFTFNLKEKTGITDLMGISKENVAIKIIGNKETINGSILITHWGFSGPAVLKLSSLYAIELFNKQYEYQVAINWVNPHNFEQLKNQVFPLDSNKKLVNTSFENISKRLWLFLLQKAEIEENDIWNQLSKKKINKLAEVLSNDIYEMKGKTTFKDEFVTCGGVELEEVDLKTFESKKIKHLYFSGEVLNIDAFTGGFNFQAAWSGGFAVANDIAKKSEVK